MNQIFALSLSNLRPLQTGHLLEISLGDHPDRELVGEAIGAIRGALDAVSRLRSDLPLGDDTDEGSRRCA